MKHIFLTVIVFGVCIGCNAQSFKKKYKQEVFKPQLNDSAFRDVVQVLGKPPAEVEKTFGKVSIEGIYTTRPEADYNFHRSGDDFKTEYVIITIKNPSLPFKKENVLDAKLFKRYGLKFPEGCKVDTVLIHHPKYKYLATIELTYSGCLNIVPVKKYEDVSNYQYLVRFISRGAELGADLTSVAVILEKKP